MNNNIIYTVGISLRLQIVRLLADHPPAPEGLAPDIGTVCVDVHRHPYFKGATFYSASHLLSSFTFVLMVA